MLLGNGVKSRAATGLLSLFITLDFAKQVSGRGDTSRVLSSSLTTICLLKLNWKDKGNSHNRFIFDFG